MEQKIMSSKIIGTHIHKHSFPILQQNDKYLAEYIYNSHDEYEMSCGMTVSHENSLVVHPIKEETNQKVRQLPLI